MAENEAFNEEVKLWNNKATLIADNLNYYVEKKYITIENVANFISEISASVTKGTNIKNPWAGTEMENTFEQLYSMIGFALEGEGTLTSLTILIALMQNGAQTITDIISFIRDAAISSSPFLDDQK